MWPVIPRFEMELDPFRELSRMQRQIGRFFDGYRQEAGAFPAVNVWTNGENAVVSAELPGVDPSTIDVTVTGNALTLQGERKPEAVSENETYHRQEREFGRFVRSIRLPFDVQNDKIEARYENGLLRITLPRREDTKPRKIEIKSE